jgi:hypothetical protein
VCVCVCVSVCVCVCVCVCACVIIYLRPQSESMQVCLLSNPTFLVSCPYPPSTPHDRKGGCSGLAQHPRVLSRHRYTPNSWSSRHTPSRPERVMIMHARMCLNMCVRMCLNMCALCQSAGSLHKMRRKSHRQTHKHTNSYTCKHTSEPLKRCVSWWNSKHVMLPIAIALVFRQILWGGVKVSGRAYVICV